MLINTPRPNRNRFMQLEAPKIFKCRKGYALILYKYIIYRLLYSVLQVRFNLSQKRAIWGHAVLPSNSSPQLWLIGSWRIVFC